MSPHRGLLVKRVIAAFLWLCGCALARGATPDAAQWTVRYLAANSTPPQRISQVLEDLGSDPQRSSTLTFDELAEYLLRHGADPQLDPAEGRNLAELLTRAPNARYRDALQRVREIDSPVVVRIFARDYVVAHRSSTGQQYVPGSIDLDALRSGFIDAAMAVEPTDARARQLDSLHTGDTLEYMFAHMGPPQHVRAVAVSMVHRLLYYYRGAGRVVFGFDSASGWRLQSVIADSLAFEPMMPYRARARELGQPDDATLRMIQLASGRLMPLKLAVDASYDLPGVPLEFLDAAAEFLAQNWKSTADYEAEDTCAWIIHLLTKKGGPRYAALLGQIKDKTKSLTLRKWARLTIQKPAGIPRQPYVTGTVSLTDLVRKFPSLYPQVVYTNGHL